MSFQKQQKVVKANPKIMPSLFRRLEMASSAYASIIINKDKFLEILDGITAQNDITSLKNKVAAIKRIIASPRDDREGLLNIDLNGDSFLLRRDILFSELDQILESRTLDRAKYYVRRLEKGIKKIKTGKINDVNLLRWKEYDEIITDSLWMLDKRDTSGVHLGWYWGNFIPQIPHQMMLRYTKKGEWVLDPFVGSGTTLIECRRLGRNGIGIELNQEVAQKARELVEKASNEFSVKTEIYVGDSRRANIDDVLARFGIKRFQLLIMHPPYHNIIKFSNDENDLSNAKNTYEFLKMFGGVVDNITPYLENGRYFALVIGDKYSKGEWIPLGFLCMQEILKRKYLLKSIIVKNFEETRGKRNQKELWRYRALVGGFYVFKHEYIMLFKKVGR